MPVTPNKRLVGAYMAMFRRTDRDAVLGLLTDDVEWEVPGAFHIHGKDAFASRIVADGFEPHPEIIMTRLVEERDVVVAEGTVRTVRTTGEVLHLAYCDIFVMRDGRIAKLTSYLMQMPPAA